MKEDPAELAARAMSDLHMFAAIAVLCESSLITVDHQPAYFRINRICRDEQQKALRRYDRAIAKVKDRGDL